MTDLGVPAEYQWDGIPEDRIEAYYEAKAKLLDELEADLPDDALVQHCSVENREMLKGLLLRRAVGLVHVLKPIEEQRRGMRWLQAQGAMSREQWASYQQAEELCAGELRSVMEEAQLVAPESPPNAIVQAAVRIYRSHGLNWPHGPAMPPAEEQGKSFENVKRGFLQGSAGGSKTKEPQLPDGLEVGTTVEAHSLQTESLNGARGNVKGMRADRVVVAFPPPIGEKALKSANLRALPSAPMIHPNAKEVPVVQFQVALQRKAGEQLGLTFQHEAPEDAQRAGHEASLLITGVTANGYVHKHNEAQPDPEQRLRPSDRVMAVADGRAKEEDRRPVSGNCKLMEELMTKDNNAVTPLILFVARVLGPPLRFKVGQRVKANCGQRGWQIGSLVNVWAESRCGGGGRMPYAVRLLESWEVVTAPKDADEFVVKAPPRFKVGDEIVANRGGNYRKGTILEVRDNPISTAYNIKMKDGTGEWLCPEELNHLVRPVARFKKGTKVLARVSDGYMPGTVEAVYHPNWVYAVRLDAGNVVMAPEDHDTFVKKK